MSVGPAAYSNKLADAAVKEGNGTLFGIILNAGSDAATVTVYDNTSAAGSIILKLAAATGTSEMAMIPGGVAFGIGIYVAMTGTAESVSVFYA